MVEFDFIIYPRKLWVGNEKELTENFFNSNGDKIEIEEEYDGLSLMVIHKESQKRGYFVVIGTELDADLISHEAVHVAMDLCKDIGIEVDVDNQEPFAYLVGFISKCISKYTVNG